MRRIGCFALVAIALFASLAHAEIHDSQKSYTEHDNRKAMLGFNRRALHDFYAANGKKDAKWDKLVEKLFDGMAVYFANFEAEPIYRLPNQPPTAELEELGQSIVDAGCDDPTARYCYAVIMTDMHGDRPEYRAIIEQCAEQLNKPGGSPSWRGVWAAERLSRPTGREDAVERADRAETFRIVAIDFIARHKYEDVDARIVYKQLWTNLDAAGVDVQREFVKALEAKKDLAGDAAWVRETIIGAHDVEAAWHLRGGGWANTVTEGGWAGFRRYLGEARDHLKKAHEMHPNWPEAAVKMITVAMGAGDELNERQREWFDRAVAAQFDYEAAYNNFLWALRPRWGGSIPSMYDVGVECAQTKRYDTRVPRLYMRTLNDIASEVGTNYWRGPGIYEQVQELYDGMVDYANKRQPPGTAEVDSMRSEQAAFAWRITRYDEARQLLDGLGDRFDASMFENVGAMGMLARSHAYAMRPGLAEQVNEAERLASVNDVDEAIKSYDAAAAPLAADDKALFFLKSRLKQLRWQKQFEAGEWVDVQPEKDLAGWSPQAGKWEVDEKGGLVGTFTTPQLAWIPCSAPFLRGNIVVEGNVELPADSNCSAGIGMTYNSLSTIYGMYLRREKGQTKGQLRRDFWPAKFDAVDLQSSNKFSFTFSAGTASAELNGQKVFDNYDVRYLWQANKSYFGVGGKFSPAGTKIRFTNLRVRSANGGDAAPTTAPIPDVHPSP
jgi:hypothetical protein